ncbi:hypothetical protein ACOME3_008440 [Neoechinorhynchus agilis]
MLGHGYWFTKNLNEAVFDSSYDKYNHVFFHTTLALLVAMSSSSAFAERFKVYGSVVYCSLITAFVYPVICHWMWSSHGWLNKLGATDSCGSSVIFLTSGVAGLVGTWFLGPRHGRFIPRLLPLFGHNMPIQTIGHILIYYGFLSLNCCTNVQSSITDLNIIGRGAYNTIIAGSTSGLEFYLLTNFWSMHGSRLKRRFHLSLSNSVIAGMVSVSSGAPVYEPWASVISGLIVPPIYILFSKATSKLRIDDPADTCSAHLSGGLVGMLLVSGLKVLSGGHHYVTISHLGIRAIKNGWWILLWNTCACLVIILWTSILIIVLFLCFSISQNYRFSFEDEIRGVDLYRYGEPAYALRIYCASCGEQLQSRVIDSNSICVDQNNEEGLSSRNGKLIPVPRQNTIITDAEGAIVPIECLTDRSSSREYNG